MAYSVVCHVFGIRQAHHTVEQIYHDRACKAGPVFQNRVSGCTSSTCLLCGMHWHWKFVPSDFSIVLKGDQLSHFSNFATITMTSTVVISDVVPPRCRYSACAIGLLWYQSFRRVSRKSVTMWEMLISLLKSPIPQWWRKWKSNPESVSGSGSPPRVNQSFSTGRPNYKLKFQWNRLISFALNPAHKQNYRQADLIAYFRLGGGENMAMYVITHSSQVRVPRRRSLCPTFTEVPVYRRCVSWWGEACVQRSQKCLCTDVQRGAVSVPRGHLHL